MQRTISVILNVLSKIIYFWISKGLSFIIWTDNYKLNYNTHFDNWLIIRCKLKKEIHYPNIYWRKLFKLRYKNSFFSPSKYELPN